MERGALWFTRDRPRGAGKHLWRHLYLLAVHQPHQALTAADVVADVAVGQPVDHVTVVHHVSGEQELVLAVVEADAAARVAGHVEHGQLPVPQVDDVTWSVRNRKQRLMSHVRSATSLQRLFQRGGT